jgi:hypothetical protein
MALPSLAVAQDAKTDAPRGYINVAIEEIELNSFAGDSFNIVGETATTVAVRGGAVVHKYFAVEGEAAFGVSNKDGDGIADYENRFAGYGRARLPFGDTGLEVFARAGYAVTSIETRNVLDDDGMPGASGDGLDGIAYGAGAAFNFGADDKFQLRLDYTEFNFGNDQDADALSLGLGFNF